MLETLKKVAVWAGPSVALLAFYAAVWGVPTLPVSLLLCGGGLALSWAVPFTVAKLKDRF